jgi:hypothetical protein
MKKPDETKPPNRYEQIIERIFMSHYTRGTEEFTFARDEIIRYARELGVELPKNLGDVIYSFRYRAELPKSVRSRAPKGKVWIIQPAGRARYRFVAEIPFDCTPNPNLADTKVPDATPGIIAMYALTDEQALLAKLRYNRLIDIFTGVTCYSLQSHLRTTLPEGDQLETDELYIGVDRRGVHYVFPVEAKSARERLGQVQIMQDLQLCRTRFAALVCRPVGAQFMEDDLIALFEFEEADGRIRIVTEKHYRLVPRDQMSPDDVEAYKLRTE